MLTENEVATMSTDEIAEVNFQDGVRTGIDDLANRILSDLFFELEGEIAETESVTVPSLREHIEHMMGLMEEANHVAFVAEELFRKADTREKNEVKFGSD